MSLDSARLQSNRCRIGVEPMRQLASTWSAAVVGVEALPVEVEVDAGGGKENFVVVGLADTAVKESRQRVKAAVWNSGYSCPEGFITASLAPADLKKGGPCFDLPIALGLLACSGQISNEKLAEWMVVGELALDGEVRAVRGALAIALLARGRGLRGLMVPTANTAEASAVEGIRIVPVRDLREAAEVIDGKMIPCPRVETAICTECHPRSGVWRRRRLFRGERPRGSEAGIGNCGSWES